MINKLARSFTKLLAEVKGLEDSIKNLPIPKDGKPGAPGIAPTAEAVAALVLEKMPTPKDGKPGQNADADTVIKEVLAQMPAPKDGKPGKDAQAPLLADVAALVLAKMPTPKDGVSPSVPAVVAEVVKLIPKPKDGVSPSAKAVAALVKVPVPKQGKTGKAGASITDVKLERNILSVWIDGVKKRVGKIDPPAVPQFAMGGNTVVTPAVQGPQNVQLETLGAFGTTEAQAPTGTGDAGKIRIHFGTGGTTADGEFTVSPDGTIACNKDPIQYDFDTTFRIERSGGGGNSEVMGRLMYAADGVEATAVQLGDTFTVRIDDDDTVWRERFEVRFSPVVGSLLWFELARNPSGNDSGGLGTFQPSGDLSGWAASNTATLTIGKLVTF